MKITDKNQFREDEIALLDTKIDSMKNEINSLNSIEEVTNYDLMFGQCNHLVGGSGTKYKSNSNDKTYARIDGGTSSPGYFTLKQ